MRAKETAPVDGHGAERLANRALPPKIFRYQTLVGTMLSAQTKDDVYQSCFLFKT